jgi:hypothetical protein
VSCVEQRTARAMQPSIVRALLQRVLPTRLLPPVFNVWHRPGNESIDRSMDCYSLLSRSHNTLIVLVMPDQSALVYRNCVSPRVDELARHATTLILAHRTTLVQLKVGHYLTLDRLYCQRIMCVVFRCLWWKIHLSMSKRWTMQRR